MTTLLDAATPTVGAVNVPAIDAPATPKKRSWLPLLTVLFLISYGLMTMLIVEQGSTIESQRALIRELMRDSTELSAMRSKSQQDKSAAAEQQNVAAPTANVQVPATQIPLTQNRSTQTPSTQAPTTTTPSSQAVQQHRTQTKADKQKPQFQMPTKPASDLIDDPRNLNVI